MRRAFFMCVSSLPLGQPQAQEDEDNGPKAWGKTGSFRIRAEAMRVMTGVR